MIGIRLWRAERGGRAGGVPYVRAAVENIEHNLDLVFPHEDGLPEE
jgi:hypothetical protein